MISKYLPQLQCAAENDGVIFCNEGSDGHISSSILLAMKIPTESVVFSMDISVSHPDFLQKSINFTVRLLLCRKADQEGISLGVPCALETTLEGCRRAQTLAEKLFLEKS